MPDLTEGPAPADDLPTAPTVEDPADHRDSADVRAHLLRYLDWYRHVVDEKLRTMPEADGARP